MKIFSYLKRRKAERERFEYDKWRLLVSLALRPRNWVCHYPFHLTNEAESMYVWIANSYYGVEFTVEGREYGSVTFCGWLLNSGTPWRRQVYNAGIKARDNPWVEKLGLYWATLQEQKKGKK